MMPGPWTPSRPRRASRPLWGMAALLLAASCAQDAPAALDPAKVGSIAVGRSSRADVFGALGQPSRTERSGLGEAWVYDAKPGGNRGLVGQASAVSGVVGVLVPYAGLVGTGLGLGAALDTPAAQASLTVTFRADGVVRDCAYSSTARPAGLSGPAGAAPPVDCQRP